MVQVNLDIKQIYKLMCPKCKAKLERLVQSRISQDMAKNMLQGKEKNAAGKDK